MQVKDKKINKIVNVVDGTCLSKKCYWPRKNPGMFMQGRGYKSYGDSRDKEYLCGTRHAHGCPTV